MWTDKKSRRDFIKTGLIWVPSALLVHRLDASSAARTRTYSAVVDKKIALNNSMLAIPHGVTPWNKLRIAMRLASTDTGASITGTPDFSVGLCCGQTNIYLDATTTHFVGIKSIATSWTRGTFGGVLYYQASGSSPYHQPIKRVGTTLTTGTGFSTSVLTMNPESASASVHRWLFFVDITKGSPNYTLNLFAASGVPNTDLSAADFLTYSAVDAVAVTGHAFDTNRTIAVDEGADGTLDHINVRWSESAPEIEISDLAAVRLL
jgi:hypothetical protein